MLDGLFHAQAIYFVENLKTYFRPFLPPLLYESIPIQMTTSQRAFTGARHWRVHGKALTPDLLSSWAGGVWVPGLRRIYYSKWLMSAIGIVG